ncbi:alcohol dehydrogenase GroES domain protein [Paraphaeosphaeria sporulosa]|uniref:Alcohol dehydrogenase GroES domain protein n=1 Tax=Paraphaeosphaeria sporulosa TaxID=1460663 RepID=A0A177BUC1_9PLEO|nr:alcohol dehydrogenase GroES domain protein [Paraphaeosphaeria sporulosa]OAF98874.1 alcohol dehydrogenase GroES domain protein [Paraphaeosphaeria sporulosa]
MRALTYISPNHPPALVEVPKPGLEKATDAIVKLKYTTICGTDLHILKGDVPTVSKGRVLGHEGVGTIEAVGAGVSSFKPGDTVLISCISACGTCDYCKRGMNSHCNNGGWKLGNTIDGTQAEFVRIPNAENSLYEAPDGIDEKVLVLLSDIFPTGFECGVLNGKVSPGGTVVIVGSGPVGLASLITAQFYSPIVIVMVDGDPHRLEIAKNLGATHTASVEDAAEVVKAATNGKGCDTVIEAVGVPASFHQCQELVAPGGVIANVGVHGVKVNLHLENLWDKNIAITTRLVDTTTTPMLLKLLSAHKLPTEKIITHEFSFEKIVQAYEIFGNASYNKALKVLISF